MLLLYNHPTLLTIVYLNCFLHIAVLKPSVVFLSCPLVKKHADLVRFFSLLTVDNEGCVQQTNKQNWTLNSNEQKALRSHCIYIKTKYGSGKGNNLNVPEQLDQESSITFEVYNDYACLKVSRNIENYW